MEHINECDYEKEYEKNQSIIRDRILGSVKDIELGKGRDFNEFFEEIENK